MIAMVGRAGGAGCAAARARWSRAAATAAAAALALGAATAVPAAAQDPPESDPVTDAGCNRLDEYDPALFGPRSERVTNRMLPLRPGTQRIFEGRSAATGVALPHRVIFTVTALVKVIDGVRSAVVWDVDEAAGKVTEAELAFFAQDRAGNVWNLGEYPEEYPQGLFVGAPNAWLAGIGDAEPGIHMPARPHVGLEEYVQGSVPDIDFLDCATVFEQGATVCPPVGCYHGVLVVHERSPLEPDGGVQVKYHAPGVGIVQIGAIGDPEAETLVLTEHNRLTAPQLQEADKQARILDQRGIQCSDVYGETEPMLGPDDGDFGPYTCGAPPPEQAQVTVVDSAPAFGPAPPPVPPAAPAAPAAVPSAAPANPLEGAFFARVDHDLLPLRRVRTTVLEGRIAGATVRVQRRVRASRPRIGRIAATAVDVERRRNGRLVERATEYYAQRRDGAVVVLGRRVARIRHGRVTARPERWIAGRRGARRGLLLPAAPQAGQRFRDGGPAGAAVARSTVAAVDNVVTTPAGRLTGCVKIRTGDRAGGATTLRAYCPRVGLAREQTGRGVLNLVRPG